MPRVLTPTPRGKDDQKQYFTYSQEPTARTSLTHETHRNAV